jgi:hypothetical protein
MKQLLHTSYRKSLTLEDVADIFVIDVNTVKGWADSKLLPCASARTEQEMKFSTEDVFAFLLSKLDYAR